MLWIFPWCTLFLRNIDLSCVGIVVVSYHIFVCVCMYCFFVFYIHFFNFFIIFYYFSFFGKKLKSAYLIEPEIFKIPTEQRIVLNMYDEFMILNTVLSDSCIRHLKKLALASIKTNNDWIICKFKCIPMFFDHEDYIYFKYWFHKSGWSSEGWNFSLPTSRSFEWSAT